MNDPIDPHLDPPAADETWFRAPTRREHLIAAWLFCGFGLFFIAMFYLCYGWGFRWVLLGLGGYSIWFGLRHARDARRSNTAMKDDNDRYLEIGPTGARKRLRGLILFLVFFAAVSAALSWLVYRFTQNWILAVVLVGFMVGYMSLMGWWTVRKPEDEEI